MKESDQPNVDILHSSGISAGRVRAERTGKSWTRSGEYATGFLEVPLRCIRISKSDGIPMGVSVGLIKGIGGGYTERSLAFMKSLHSAIPAPAEYQAITDPPDSVH